MIDTIPFLFKARKKKNSTQTLKIQQTSQQNKNSQCAKLS